MKINFLFPLIASLLLLSCAGPEQKTEAEIKNSDWHYQMGAGYFQSQELPLAIRECRTAIEMDSENFQAHHLLGFIYMGRRDFDKALFHFNETLRIEPEFVIALNNRGTVYLETKRWREAADDFKVLLDNPLYPTPELAHNNLGWALHNLKKYAKAVENYRMAVFLKPEMCLAYNNMGLSHLAMGQRTDAAENFQKAINKCPKNYAQPHFELGRLMQEEGIPGARAHFELCQKIEPDTNLGRRCRQYLQIQ